MPKEKQYPQEKVSKERREELYTKLEVTQKEIVNLTFQDLPAELSPKEARKLKEEKLSQLFIDKKRIMSLIKAI